MLDPQNKVSRSCPDSPNLPGKPPGRQLGDWGLADDPSAEQTSEEQGPPRSLSSREDLCKPARDGSGRIRAPGIGINFPRMNKIGIQSVNTRLGCLNLMHELMEQDRSSISNRFKRRVLLEARIWKRFQRTLVSLGDLNGKSPVLQMVTPL